MDGRTTDDGQKSHTMSSAGKSQAELKMVALSEMDYSVHCTVSASFQSLCHGRQTSFSIKRHATEATFRLIYMMYMKCDFTLCGPSEQRPPCLLVIRPQIVSSITHVTTKYMYYIQYPKILVCTNAQDQETSRHDSHTQRDCQKNCKGFSNPKASSDLTYHKPSNTLRQMLIHPKDKNKKEQQCGVVCEITCEDCKEKYVGEAATMLGTRLKEHSIMKGQVTSGIAEHMKDSGHRIKMDKVRLLRRENNNHRRKIKEAI